MDEFPKKNISDKNIEQKSPEKRAFELRRRAFSLIRSSIENLWKRSAGEHRKKDFVSEIIQGAMDIVPEAAEEINTKFKSLSGPDAEENVETFLNQVTEITIEIMTKYASLKELEKRFQIRHVRQHRYQPLSRGLNFEINKNNQIILHVPITFFEGPKTALQSFIEGLKILAQKMMNDADLKDVKEIVGHSILVEKNYRLLERLGFNITFDENGQPTQEARILKEKLLQIYGK